MNPGKKFELDWKKSVTNDVFIYRLRDSPANFGNDDDKKNTRFAASNICDFIMFDSKTLFLLELKSTKDRAIPLANFMKKPDPNKEKKGRNKIEQMVDALKFENLISGYVVNFRTFNRTYFIKSDILEAIYLNSKKSAIDVSVFETYAIQVRHIKMKTNFKYDIKKFIHDTSSGNISDKRGLF